MFKTKTASRLFTLGSHAHGIYKAFDLEVADMGEPGIKCLVEGYDVLPILVPLAA